MRGFRRSAPPPKKVPNVTAGVFVKYVTVCKIMVLYTGVVKQYLMKQIEKKIKNNNNNNKLSLMTLLHVSISARSSLGKYIQRHGNRSNSD